MKKERLGFEINHCARVIRRYIDTNAIKSHVDEMTGTHGWAIAYFYDHRDRDIFQKDFEKEFDIRRSTASNILALMEKNGLIIRESVPQDARLKKIILTQKAVDIHKKVSEAFEKMEEEISAGLSKEEISVLLNTLQKIKNNIERMTEDND